MKFHLQNVRNMKNFLHFIFYYSILNIKSRVGKTLFGLLWLPSAFAVLALIKIVVFSNSTLSPMYIVSGFLIWSFIGPSLTEGARAFSSKRGSILAGQYPLYYYCYLQIGPIIAIHLLNFTVFVVLFCLFGGTIDLYNLLFVSLGYLNLFFLGTLNCYFFGTMGCLFPDMRFFIENVTRVIFFATPILWAPNDNYILEIINHYNVFSHIIAIIRDPLLYGVVPLKSWIIVNLFSLVYLFVTWCVFKRKHGLIGAAV